jgi:hypothetical protein
MGAAISLREDFGSGELRALAKMVKDAGQARRLLALAVVYDGGKRTTATFQTRFRGTPPTHTIRQAPREK